MDEAGNRRLVHPTKVTGRWASRRAIVQTLLVGFFLVLPWLRIGGNPVLLLDIGNRKFSLLGIRFFAHDTPVLFLFVFGFIVTFGLLTALYGRVWCGWACPQTVFVDRIFRAVETLTEGSAEARRARDRAGVSAPFAALFAKWAIYLAISLVITHSFLAIFIGTEALGAAIAAGPESAPFAFTFIVFSTLGIAFDFGWFREQFCIVVCPYGRIQSVFQDAKTTTVAYDAKRGEPRGAKRSDRGNVPKGDCVDCFRCVRVCPTGIDIRDGSSQLECIACTACIDACDDVMKRLDRAPGLIRYASVVELESGAKQSPFASARVFGYSALLAAIAIALAFSLRSDPVTAEIFKTKGTPYTIVESESVPRYANAFLLEVSSRTDLAASVRIAADETDANGVTVTLAASTIELAPGEMKREPFTATFPRTRLSGGRATAKIRITTRTERGTHETTQEVTLVGPF